MKSLSCHEWIIYLLKPNTGRHLYIRTTVSAAHLTLDRCNDYFAVISSLIWSRSWASAWEWGPAWSCQTAALAASWSLTKHHLHCTRPRTSSTSSPLKRSFKVVTPRPSGLWTDTWWLTGKLWRESTSSYRQTVFLIRFYNGLLVSNDCGAECLPIIRILFDKDIISDNKAFLAPWR